jgi:thymidylate kinase
VSEILELFASQSKVKRIETEGDMPLILPFPQLDSRQHPLRSAASAHKIGRKGDQPAAPIPLIKKLCDTLNAQRISYCQWKSNWKLHHWLSGEGDLDLLIDRADAQRFVGLIQGLGFKQAEPSSDRMVPGILNFYGFDQEASRFVHLHVHYQLVIGHDLTKNFHLPIEQLYLENVTRTGIIPVPAVEFELVVFVLRMVLKHSTFESILRRGFRRRPSISAVEQELQQLKSKANPARVAAILPQVVPGVDPVFFNACEQSLRTSASLRSRTAARRELQRRLHTFARRSIRKDALLKLYRGVTRTVTKSIFRRPARKKFVNGGILIAIVGGDGAGKTTALNALNKWLGKKFVTKCFHIGKPARSPFTLITIVCLRIRQLLGNNSNRAIKDESAFPGYLQLVRWVFAGRDRCRLYTEARRFATNGGIALCDRYPLPQIRRMESANISHMVEAPRQNEVVRRLLRAETGYYEKIMAPDLLIVLRVDPEIAVRRKTTESEHHVRSRTQEIWEMDWDGSNAYVINAAQPVEDVLKQLQSIIWAKL